MSDNSRPKKLAILDPPRAPFASFSSQTPAPAPVFDVRESGTVFYTSSGRAAIVLGLKALGIGPGDVVLVPTYHCPTVVAPIVHLGAEPLFYPITPDGRPDQLWLDQHGRGVDALIVPHYFGIARDLAFERAFCDRNGIRLLEDCAHAFFGLAGDRGVGTWGDVATASFPKFFPVSEGGALVLRTAPAKDLPLRRMPVAKEVRAWLDILETSAAHGGLGMFNPAFASVFRLKRRLRASGRRSIAPAPRPITDCLDEPMIHMQASMATRSIVANSNVKRLVTLRRKNYMNLIGLMRDVQGVTPVFPELPDHAVPYVCPILVADADCVYKRLRADGVPVLRWDLNWPGTPSIEGDAGPFWSTALLQIVCHQELTDRDMRGIAERIAARLADAS